jgi:hypothetical protein
MEQLDDRMAQDLALRNFSPDACPPSGIPTNCRPASPAASRSLRPSSCHLPLSLLARIRTGRIESAQLVREEMMVTGSHEYPVPGTYQHDKGAFYEVLGGR